MRDESNESIARDLITALEAKHIEQVLSCFSDGGVWIAPEGAFTGKAQMERYLSWQLGLGEDVKLTESGNGAVVEGDRAFLEYTFHYRLRGQHVEYTVLCALELKDGKVAIARSVYDRLSLEQKLAKSRISRWAIDRILKEAEKGLRWARG